LNKLLKIRVYALKDYVDEGYAEETLNMTKNIYDSLKDIFRLVNESSFAEKIGIISFLEIINFNFFNTVLLHYCIIRKPQISSLFLIIQ
jgi:hypothetical protein